MSGLFFLGSHYPVTHFLTQKKINLTPFSCRRVLAPMLNPESEFQRALGLLRQGREAEAGALCETLLRQDPDDANFLWLLGAIRLGQRSVDAAIPLLQRAVALEPDFAQAHEDLGTALLRAGAAKQALPHLERATALAPTHAPGFMRLAEARLALGQTAEADAAFERAFALNPQQGALARAGELFHAKKFTEAERIAREVAQQDPNNVNALRLLAKLAGEAEQRRDAVALYERIVTLAPDFMEAWREYALALKEAWRVEEAIAAARKALALAPDNPRLNVLWAGLCALSGNPAGAVEGFEQSLRLRPNSPGALLGHGHVMKTLGRQAEGIESYRKAIRAKPDFGEAFWSLANLKTFRFSDADVTAMEAQINNAALEEDALVHFCFALGKACEDRREFDRAFEFYDRANRMQRMRIEYDPVQTQVEHDDIISVFTPALFDRLQGQGHPDPAPILIVGLPRSGSTLIEQVLASHSHVDGTSELPELGRLVRVINRGGQNRYPAAVRAFTAGDCVKLGQRYLDATQRHRRGRPRFTDKMPNNFALVGLLRVILPNAKVINARRHPLDSCLGCYKQHFASGQTFTYDLIELGEFYLEYERLMAHWHRVLPGFVLDIQYEDMVADQERQTRRLLEFCGLPFEPACLEFHKTERPVQTASSEQVRQPLYADSVHYWRHFEQHLAVLKDVLAPILN